MGMIPNTSRKSGLRRRGVGPWLIRILAIIAMARTYDSKSLGYHLCHGHFVLNGDLMDREHRGVCDFDDKLRAKWMGIELLSGRVASAGGTWDLGS